MEICNGGWKRTRLFFLHWVNLVVVSGVVSQQERPGFYCQLGCTKAPVCAGFLLVASRFSGICSYTSAATVLPSGVSICLMNW